MKTLYRPSEDIVEYFVEYIVEALADMTLTDEVTRGKNKCESMTMQVTPPDGKILNYFK